jgi:hypothetical protein
MAIHHAASIKNSAIAIAGVRRLRENQNAKITNRANATARAKRAAGQGRFE